MPTFFFDIWAEGKLYPDGTGLDLDTVCDARQHALRLMARIIRETPTAYDWTLWSVTIAGADGASLATMRFPLAGQAPSDKPQMVGLIST